MRLFALLLSGILAGTVVPVYSQAPPAPPAPAAPKNMLSNPSFETGFRRDNLWDGVDTGGALAGERSGLPVLTTSGAISETSMPISVAVEDLNGDGLFDIAAMDPIGYLRVYFNSGNKTEPKFTVGELAGIFLSRVDPADPTLQGVTRKYARSGQRICLSDITRSGKKDLVVGNYLGEIMILMNGSGVRPDFRQPSNIAQAIIPTMKDSLKKWGNVFAPTTFDWNRDGKDDLLVGEGSYSANSIHLLLNQGSGARPIFEENNSSVLAYGMGLEQLTPCIVDYNGDGKMDLLVTERSGKVAVYLNAGKPWRAGDTLPFDSFLSIGGAKPAPAAAPAAAKPVVAATSKDPMVAATAPGLLSVGGIATLAAADMNGDGLFDLVFGKSNGKIALSVNTGTKTDPKFAAPVEIKGEAGTPPFNVPSGWECNFGLDRGNFNGFVSVVKEADDPQALPFPDGKACLKAGYIQPKNRVMAVPAPAQYPPAFPTWKPPTGKENDLTYIITRNTIDMGTPSSYFEVRQEGTKPLKNNKTYSFSMKVKGNKVSDAFVGITFWGRKELGATRFERQDRGVIRKENKAEERNAAVFRINSVSPQWSEVKGELTVKFKDKDLAAAALDGKDGELTWGTSIIFNLAPGTGTLYVDDIKLIEK
ncbi:MAG: VCBS repeat-containing protein [Verrucomicrobiae bacterium]